MKSKSLSIIPLISLIMLIMVQSSYVLGPGLGWLYSRTITLSPATASANFQVKITLSAGQYGHMNSDGSDLRFYDNNDNLCNYWIETGGWNTTGNSNVWVKVPNSGTTSLTMYYGNASASSASNGTSTFELFDDFTGSSLDGSKWTKVNGGTPSFGSGLMTISAQTDPGKIIANHSTTENNYSIVARFKVTGGTNADERAGVGVKTGTGGMGYNYVFHNFSALTGIQYLYDGVTWGSSIPNTWSKNTFYIMEVFHDGSNVRGRINYGAWNTPQAWTSLSGYLALNIGSFDATTAWDWAFIRQCFTSEPGATVGSEVQYYCNLTGASGFTVEGTTSTSVTFHWTRGNGTGGVIVVARQQGVSLAGPIPGTQYNPSLNFSSPGTPNGTTGAGNVVVYNGSGSSAITVTGLTQNIQYYFDFYEYNTGYCYTGSAYEGTIATCTAPATTPTSLNFTNISNNSMTVNWTNASTGDAVIVLVKPVLALVCNECPVVSTSYSEQKNSTIAYKTCSQIGNAYIIYNDHGPVTNSSSGSVTITGLNGGVTYYFATYSYNYSSGCYNLTALTGSSATSMSTVFYNNLAGASRLDLLANWGDNTDGSGSQPASFTTAGQWFYITNGAAASIGANWTVFGVNSKVIVGDGTNACTFTIPGNAAYSSTETSVSNNATLEVRDNPVISPGTFTYNTGSTLLYSGTVLRYNYSLDGQHEWTTPYNVVVTNTTNVYIFMTNTVTNNLSINGGTISIAAGGTATLNVGGNITLNSGTIQGATAGGDLNVYAGASPAYQGNIYINGGTFYTTRYLSGSGSVKIYGNIILGGGTIYMTDRPNTYHLYIAGDITLNSGTLNLTNAGGLFFNGGNNAVQNFIWSGGTITGAGFFGYNTTSSNLKINESYSSSTVAQTTINGTSVTSPPSGYAAFPTSGTVINNVTINNPNGVILSIAKAVNGTLYLYNGTFTNSNTLTMAAGSSIVRTAGSLSAIPVFGSSINVTYGVGTYSNAITTARELPASATVLNNLTLNASGGVTLNAPATVNGILALTNGILNTSGTNIININNSSTSAITGYSASNYIKGPMSRALQAGVNTDGTTYFYPLADENNNYRPLELVNIRTGSASPVVKVTLAGSNASTFNSPLLSISPRNWYVELISGNFTSSAIRLTESSLTASNIIGISSVQSGPYSNGGYNNIGSTISSNPGMTIPGYFAIGTHSTAIIALSDNAPQVINSNVAPGTTNVVLHKSALAITGEDATLTGMTCTAAGTYLSADITSLKLYYSSGSSFNAETCTLLSTITTLTTAGQQTFPSFLQIIPNGTTGYIFITADIAPGATGGNTININVLANSDFTFSKAYITGNTISNGGVQTITVPSVTLSDNGTVAPASVLVGSNDVVLHKSAIAVTGVGATLTGMTCTTAGTYLPADITSLKLYYSTSSAFSGRTPLSTITPVTAGSQTFSFSPQLLPVGTVYFFITADISQGAIPGNTINIAALTTSDFTFMSGSKSGSSSDGGVQTISVSVFYNNSSTLNSLSSWGINTDGSGSHPANFTTTGQWFYITNGAAASIGDNWTVSGVNSKVIVGDGTNACTFTIPGNAAYSSTETSVSNNATLEVRDNPVISPGTFTYNTGSTLLYSGTVLRYNYSLDGQHEWTTPYNVVVINTTNVYIFMTNTVTNNLTINGGTISIAAGGTATLYVGGNISLNSGTIQGATASGVLNVYVGASPAYQGNIYANGGTFYPTRYLSGSGSVKIYGNIIIGGGTIYLTDRPNTYHLYIAGDITLNSGTLDLTNAGGLFFNGGNNAEQNFIWAGGTISGSGFFGYNTASSNLKINESYSSATTAQTTINGTSLSSPPSGYAAFPTSGSVINNVTINNPNGVTLSTAKTINGALALNNGILSIGNNNLTVMSELVCNECSSSKYIKTNGTGQLKLTVPSSPVTFPVGNSGYNPLIITNSGTSDTYGVRVIDAVTTPAPNDASKLVNRYWYVSEGTSGGSVLNLTAQWNSGETNSNYAAGTFVKFGYYVSNWGENITAQTGSDPYTASSGDITISDLTGGVYFGVGKDGAFIVHTPPAITSLGSTGGCTGDNITINGSDLTEATAVTIGGTAVTSVTSNTGTQIIAVIGAGTTGTVSVTTPYGTGTSDATFTVNIPISITTEAAPASQVVCINAIPVSLTITATGTGLTYQWYSNATNSNIGGTSVGSDNGGQTGSYTPSTAISGTLYYYCVVSGTCSLVAISSTVFVAVNALPIITSQPIAK